MSFLDWGACGTILGLIAFFYGIYVEQKVNKLNNRIAKDEEEIKNLSLQLSSLRDTVFGELERLEEEA